MKRVLDVLLALGVGLFFLPIIVVAAVMISVTDGAPILFRQVRVGRNGTHFVCFKFRTMTRDSEVRLKAVLDTDPERRAEWEETRKLKDDPRILGKVGWFLRKSSLDELPQLLNVLNGDMSIVGPRPMVPDELERYGDKLSRVLSVKPGLTGPWQVSGRSDTTYDERIRLDYAYARSWSLKQDFDIVLKTVQVVLTGRGAY
ncbi:MAG: sugar transferase [Pseudomonadota bacterium]